MLEFFDSKFIAFTTWMNCKKDAAKEEFDKEDGVSALVATVILILIVVLLAAIFWDWIKEFFKSLTDRVETEAQFKKE